MENFSMNLSEIWRSKAYEYLLKYVDEHKGVSFMIEDVREYAEKKGFDCLSTKREWGVIAIKARKEGIIKKIGYDVVKNEKAHSTPATMWVSK